MTDLQRISLKMKAAKGDKNNLYILVMRESSERWILENKPPPHPLNATFIEPYSFGL